MYELRCCRHEEHHKRFSHASLLAFIRPNDFFVLTLLEEIWTSPVSAAADPSAWRTENDTVRIIDQTAHITTLVG